TGGRPAAARTADRGIGALAETGDVMAASPHPDTRPATPTDRPSTRLRLRAMRSRRGDREPDAPLPPSSLHELGRSLLAAASREAVAEASIRHVQHLVRPDYASLILFEEHGQTVVLAAFTGGTRIGGTRWDRAAFGSVEWFAQAAPVVVTDLA